MTQDSQACDCIFKEFKHGAEPKLFKGDIGDLEGDETNDFDTEQLNFCVSWLVHFGFQAQPIIIPTKNAVHKGPKYDIISVNIPPILLIAGLKISKKIKGLIHSQTNYKDNRRRRRFRELKG